MNLMVGNTTMNGLKHHLRVEPYDYQREGIVYGLEHRRLIIGDEPGLGKTLQSIGIVDTANAYPCLTSGSSGKLRKFAQIFCLGHQSEK